MVNAGGSGSFSSHLQGLVEQILLYGRVVRPALGIALAPPQLARQLGFEGVLVLDVPPGSPASKAGIRGTYRDMDSGSLVLGDVIVGIDGKPVRGLTDLFDRLDEKKVGDRVRLDLLRDGGQTKSSVEVELGERVVGQVG